MEPRETQIFLIGKIFGSSAAVQAFIKDEKETETGSIAVYPKGNEDNTKDIMLIEKCLEVCYRWQEIAPSPASYAPKVDNNFKTIDLSVVDGFMPRIE